MRGRPGGHEHVHLTIATVLVIATGVLLVAGTGVETPVGVAGLALLALGAGAVPVAVGMHQHRRRNRELERREHEFERQREALVQQVSHEIRTPLTVIRGSLETLRVRMGGGNRPDVASLLDATDRSVTRLEDMMEVLLAGADELSVHPTQTAPVDLASVVRHAAETVRRSLPAQLQLDLRDHEDLVTVEPHLWLLLRCLLDNAARFAPDDTDIVVSSRRHGNELVVAVRDHGPGLPDGFRDAAFSAFTQGDGTTARDHAGLGLGLYTARRLAHRLGGQLRLHDAESGGTVAEFVLPLATEVLHLDAEEREPAPTRIGPSPHRAG